MRGSVSAVVPSNPEVPSMTVWPSIAAFPLGRKVGQLCSIGGVGKFFTVGKLMALITIPLSLGLFFWRLAPGVAKRYLLTDRRVVVLKGLGAVEGESIDLSGFDSIDVEVLAGQKFLRAGDLVFRSDGKEVFRLPGVQHPDGFCRACVRGRQALLSVSRVLAEQAGGTEVVGAVGDQSV